ncbi:MAG: LysM peptidoglycan-binding domain-containing protein [Bdellovibrionales bacterium]
MNQLLKVCSVSLFLFAGVIAKAETYTVKKGDTLASIARTRYGEPVFGPKGTIKKIYKMNPSLKANIPLEKGQKIKLESKIADFPAEQVLPLKAAPVTEAPEVPTPPLDTASYLNAAQKAAHEKDLKPEVTEAHEPVHEAVHEKAEKNDEEHSHNYFSFIASYSLIAQTATESVSGESFAMHSNPAVNAEIGWDHWWNDSFSTLLTYSATQISSKESSDQTGEKILKNVNLNRTEFALLNRVVRWMRFGAGAAYGDHIFLESFTGTFKNPQVYKWSYLNPFITAEITPHESARFEWLVNLKISQLPAQTGLGHDIASGTEYFAQLACMQKLAKYSMLYGVSYSTEDQTRTDAKEKRNETALKIGVLF